MRPNKDLESTYLHNELDILKFTYHPLQGYRVYRKCVVYTLPTWPWNKPKYSEEWRIVDSYGKAVRKSGFSRPAPPHPNFQNRRQVKDFIDKAKAVVKEEIL